MGLVLPESGYVELKVSLFQRNGDLAVVEYDSGRGGTANPEVYGLWQLPFR